MRCEGGSGKLKVARGLECVRAKVSCLWEESLPGFVVTRHGDADDGHQ